MRTNIAVVTLLCLVAPAARAADFVVRPVDPAAIPPTLSADQSAPALVEKVDSPYSLLVVPYYEVDTKSAVGKTTLFAVHNVTAKTMLVTFLYIPSKGPAHAEDTQLAPRATYTRNVRDVNGLPVDPDGFARGWVEVIANAPVGAKVMTGDFLQVDPFNNFATGDRMIRRADLCKNGEIRFLDFGKGTELRLYVDWPRGDDPKKDPPSATLWIYDQAGKLQAAFDFFTKSSTIFVNTDDLNLPVAFGQVKMSFDASNGGYVYAVYSAEARFSVGMNSACID